MFTSPLHRALHLLSPISLALVLVLLLLLLTTCGQPETDIHALNSPMSTLPHLVKQIQLTTGAAKGVLNAQHQVYFLGDTGVARVAGTKIIDQITLPNLAPPYGQILLDIATDSHKGMAYVLDNFVGVINVISNTTLVTTLVGISEQPWRIVADEDSGEMYVFYTSQASGKPSSHVVVLSETKKITDIVLPAFTKAARYNPVDGHIYVVGSAAANYSFVEDDLMVLDNHRILATIRPLDERWVGVKDIAINAQTGDIYILQSTRVKYWDRVHPPKSIDLYNLGYTNPLNCIVVDPKHGWAYVCSWMAEASRILVVDKDQLVAAIPVAKSPAALAVDSKHDYVYVGHYDPTNLSVIRGTELITTLNIVGYGTSDVIVDEDRGYIYTANGDDRSVDVFSFDPPIAQPASWRAFLPWLGK